MICEGAPASCAQPPFAVGVQYDSDEAMKRVSIWDAAAPTSIVAMAVSPPRSRPTLATVALPGSVISAQSPTSVLPTMYSDTVVLRGTRAVLHSRAVCSDWDHAWPGYQSRLWP